MRYPLAQLLTFRLTWAVESRPLAFCSPNAAAPIVVLLVMSEYLSGQSIHVNNGPRKAEGIT